MELVALIYISIFAAAGLALARLVLGGERPLLRITAGLAFGLALLMWLPALCAFALGFTLLAQYIALALAAALLALCALLIRRRPSLGVERFSLKRERRALISCAPLVLLTWVLMLNHVITAASDGSLHSGQSTYGDMCMHLSFITSISVQEFFPPEYSIMPGEALGYPFLCDSVSSTFYTLGTSLRFAALLPMLYAALCVVLGAYCLFETWLGRRAAPLALYIFFIGGGFGFAYFLDLSKTSGAGSLHELMHGFYQTPTNQTELGLRWVNPIADMLVPQRATLFGWALLFPAMALFYRAAIERETRLFYPLGALAGLMPLAHTHSFLALGIVSLFLLAAQFVRALRSPGREAAAYLRSFVLYGLIAAAIAAPQLFAFTFRQAGAGGFLRLETGWANTTDSWLWFYVKNWGLVFLLLLPAFFGARRESRLFAGGGFLIWLLCEFIVFQPNPYDNNKLLFVTWLLCCGLTAEYLLSVWDRLREGAGALERAGSAVLAALTAALLFTSGAMTLAREYVSGDHLGAEGYAESGYSVVSPGLVELAEYVGENTPPDAVFITATNHNNAVAMLTGRSIVCGSPSFLYYHGFDCSEREADLAAAYERPGECLGAVAEKYSASYLLVSAWERGSWDVDEAWLAENLSCVFENAECTLYELEN